MNKLSLLKLTKKMTTLMITSVVFFPIYSWAGSTSGADFLKIPIGAETASLGQASSAMSSGVSALNSNPAGISQKPKQVSNPTALFSFSHQDHFQQTTFDHVGVVFPGNIKSKNVTYGFNILRLSYGKEELRGENREVLGHAESSDLAIGGAFGLQIQGVQIGSQVKIIRQSLAGETANGYALDLGVLSRTSIRGLQIGGSIRNLGPQMNFISENFKLPLTLSLGAAFQVKGPLTFALDLIERPHQKQFSVAFGSEFRASSSVALRAGYLTKLADSVVNNRKTDSNSSSIGNLNGLTGGIGIKLSQFSIDYAMTPFADLGNVQTFTLSTWFGGTKPASTPVFMGPDTKEQPSKDLYKIDSPAHEPFWDKLKF
ncbi:MAG: PorV/PorQ family protein [Elusimicrobiota bacterium]